MTTDIPWSSLLWLCDPLNGSLMEDPMVTKCGHSYSKCSSQIILDNGVCYVCGTSVSPNDIFPNVCLQFFLSSLQTTCITTAPPLDPYAIGGFVSVVEKRRKKKKNKTNKSIIQKGVYGGKQTISGMQCMTNWSALEEFNNKNVVNLLTEDQMKQRDEKRMGIGISKQHVKGEGEGGEGREKKRPALLRTPRVLGISQMTGDLSDTFNPSLSPSLPPSSTLTSSSSSTLLSKSDTPPHTNSLPVQGLKQTSSSPFPGIPFHTTNLPSHLQGTIITKSESAGDVPTKKKKLQLNLPVREMPKKKLVVDVLRGVSILPHALITCQVIFMGKKKFTSAQEPNEPHHINWNEVIEYPISGKEAIVLSLRFFSGGEVLAEKEVDVDVLSKQVNKNLPSFPLSNKTENEISIRKWITLNPMSSEKKISNDNEENKEKEKDKEKEKQSDQMYSERGSVNITKYRVRIAVRTEGLKEGLGLPRKPHSARKTYKIKKANKKDNNGRETARHRKKKTSIIRSPRGKTGTTSVAESPNNSKHTSPVRKIKLERSDSYRNAPKHLSPQITRKKSTGLSKTPSSRTQKKKKKQEWKNKRRSLGALETAAMIKKLRSEE